jgi:nitrogen fixation protein NifU and related proteins
MITEDIYKENILDHYRNPRNKTTLTNPTHKQTEKNPLCGDELTLYLNIENNLIKEISFQGSGCAISQASMSLLTEHLQGMDITEALKLTTEDANKILGISVNYTRQKCASLALKALHKAVEKC